jgi:hypothetical protein
MAHVEWSMKGPELANCNCAWGCPCQFNALPTTGNCRFAAATQIEKGNYGDVKLDGLKWALLGEWPGPIHLGNGTLQLVIDERADAKQRAALEAIGQGKDTDEGATYMWVFGAMSSKRLPTLFKPIELQINVDKRTAQLRIPGIVDTKVESIRNPVTGAEHRAKVSLAAGFEYTEAEFASGTTKATGDVKLDLQGTHAHLANVHLTTHGLVR